MDLISEPLPGVKIFRPFVFEDERGEFVKPFHTGQLSDHGIKFPIEEEFFSTSAKNVLRGMHFQIPPAAHQKLVYCISGKVLDVVLDLRRRSPSFGRATSFELSDNNRHIVHIPVGFAHGFLSLEDDSCLVYKTDRVHSPESDLGILWSSIKFDWPIAEGSPFISARDQLHVKLADFRSPF